MCKRHSFILTRAGKVCDGLGVTDSHTEIREIHGLHANDDSVNAYEWQPPDGWPNADWNLGLTKDLEVFETKSSHDAAMERHVRTLYPSMSEWEAGDKPRVTGEVLRSIGWTELTPEISEGGITAGRFFLSDSATLNASSQQGGYCWACDSATLNASSQQGGDCRAYGSATLNASSQQGGQCWAYDSATLNASSQQGGQCWAYGSATLNASSQQGGDCWAYGSATLNASSQQGGYCWAYDSATLNKK